MLPVQLPSDPRDPPTGKQQMHWSLAHDDQLNQPGQLLYGSVFQCLKTMQKTSSVQLNQQTAHSGSGAAVSQSARWTQQMHWSLAHDDQLDLPGQPSAAVQPTVREFPHTSA